MTVFDYWLILLYFLLISGIFALIYKTLLQYSKYRKRRYGFKDKGLLKWLEYIKEPDNDERPTEQMVKDWWRENKNKIK